jgi:hypothetical protein
MIVSPFATSAAAFPACPVVFEIRSHQLLLFGGTAAIRLDASKYVHR